MNYVSRAARGHRLGAARLVFKTNLSARRIRDDRELRRDLDLKHLNRKPLTETISITFGAYMNENSAFLNELINVEELEQKIAPSGSATLDE